MNYFIICIFKIYLNVFIVFKNNYLIIKGELQQPKLAETTYTRKPSMLTVEFVFLIIYLYSNFFKNKLTKIKKKC